MSEGTESPLKTWGLFKSRGCGLLHMEQPLLAAFRRAVLRAANGWEGLLRWDGLMDERSVSSHSQGSAAQQRHMQTP